MLVDSRYDGPVSLTTPVLNQAQATLQRWRHRIAAWGNHPSVPMPREVVARCIAAIDDNLDVSSLIRALIDLEDDDVVRPGANFETFLYFDRVLAFDLARHLGAARPAEANARYDR